VSEHRQQRHRHKPTLRYVDDAGGPGDRVRVVLTTATIDYPVPDFLVADAAHQFTA
jgi:hypothetical protein